MGASEDELAKKQVQEAVWVWSGRILVLAVTFGFGFFTAWILWGAGITGAPALREKTVQQDAAILEMKNKRVDLDGKIVVLEGRLQQCDKTVADLRAKAAATP